MQDKDRNYKTSTAFMAMAGFFPDPDDRLLLRDRVAQANAVSCAANISTLNR
ncbi:hypothetical protein [Variovorax sp. J22R115]|uniref:hypothetical protein n=1 Tax=Variovorax sp. J22R115 TaxID=3053509 RepID=UPI0025778919|nr:hypothetical protein [Variovorax sp. J22R115]MDM0053021.1 hypothetical protein [Variovorax sp. J22R115]